MQAEEKTALMTDGIFTSPIFPLLLLIGLAAAAVLLVRGVRFLRNGQRTLEIIRAQELRKIEPGLSIPTPWRELRVDVEASNRVLNRQTFEHARRLFLDCYAAGAVTPAGITDTAKDESFRLVVDEHGRGGAPVKDMVELFRQTAAERGLFRGWFCEDVIAEGKWAGLRTLLAAAWLCKLAGFRYRAAHLWLDLPHQPGLILARLREGDGTADDPRPIYDLPCAAAVEGMYTPEAALEMELLETCGLGFGDLDGLRLMARYNSYAGDGEDAENVFDVSNEHRLLFRAQLKPESAAAGLTPGLQAVALAELRQLHLSSAMAEALRYCD